MAMIERLGIAGVGLIGGSLALAARRAGVAREIVGLGRTRANLDLALARGILDRADVTPDILAGADLVLLATPIGLLAATAQAIAPHLAPGAIVTDAGSVKANVVRDCVSSADTRSPGPRIRVRSRPIPTSSAARVACSRRSPRAIVPRSPGYARCGKRSAWRSSRWRRHTTTTCWH